MRSILHSVFGIAQNVQSAYCELNTILSPGIIAMNTMNTLFHKANILMGEKEKVAQYQVSWNDKAWLGERKSCPGGPFEWVGKYSQMETSEIEEVNDKKKPSGRLMLLHLHSLSQ